MEKFKINLRDLFKLPKKDLPSWVDDNNVIYRIRNVINNKSYIGKSKNFYKRFITDNWSHYNTYVNYCIDKSTGIYLYNAIRKYGSKNFEVSLLIINSDNLNQDEIYWINKLHTCIMDSNCAGYNMTYGGEDTSHMNTKECHDKSLESNRRNHNGVLAWNSKKSHDKSYLTQLKDGNGVLPFNKKESISSSLITRTKLYGSPVAAAMRPESREKAKNTLASQYDGDCCGHLHNKEVRNKINNTVIERYGGLMGQCHSESVYHLRMINNWFRDSDKYKSLTTDLNSYYNRCTYRHVDVLLDNYEELKIDGRWTNFHQELYEFILKLK